MELNSRSPGVWWDREDPVVFPSRGVPEKMLLVDTDIEAGSFHSSGDGIGGSATLSHCFSQDLSCTKESASGAATTPSMADIFIGSGDSLIGLKLGKRTYFEAVSGGSSSSKESPVVSNGTVKRSKIYSQSTEIPHCQVEGCSLDLSSAKDYHRKHRVCETHSKSSKVIIRGLERRFCQQCSRFHGMSEFDQKKRSCRRRLSDHNARRRKPKQEIIQFNPSTLHSSLHEGRNQISFAFNQVPLIQTRTDSSNSKLIKGRVGLFSPLKTEMQATWIRPQETGFTDSYCSTQALQFKEAPVEFLHQGLQVITSSNSLDAAQNPSALSLLSTNSWGLGVPPGPAPPPLHHTRPLRLPPVSAEYWEQSSHHALSLLSSHSWSSCEPDPTPPPLLDFGLPSVSAGYWQQSSPPGLEVHDENTTRFQQFQLKEPNESCFYLY